MNKEEDIVQKQLNAYNNLNLEEFSSLYSEDIEIYNFADPKPFIKGIAALKKVYKEVFESSPLLKATITKRIVFDNKIIDEEEVTGRKGTDFIKVVVIYEVNSDLISKVTFIRKL